MLLEKGAEVDLTVKVPESKRESDYDCEEDEDHDFDTHGTYAAQAKLMEIHVQPVNGSTGALLALAGGHFKVYDLLVSDGADTTIVDSNGVSCLQLAAHFGRLDYVTALLKSQQVGSAVEGGVTTNETTSSSSSVTALSPHAAAAAQVQAADRRGITALHRAVSAHPRATEDSLKICEILLSHGADVNARTVHGDAPLHFACLKTGTVAVSRFNLF
jgi:ankyrin repeat protein